MIMLNDFPFAPWITEYLSRLYLGLMYGKLKLTPTLHSNVVGLGFCFAVGAAVGDRVC